jgi:DnaJ-class molecular chaperone
MTEKGKRDRTEPTDAAVESGLMACTLCGGQGVWPRGTEQTCTSCHGTGRQRLTPGVKWADIKKPNGGAQS